MTDYKAFSSSPNITFSGARLPTQSELGAKTEDIFQNTLTGELFVCDVQTFGSQVWKGSQGNNVGVLDPIIETDHPDLLFMYTMDNISGATLEDESPNNNDGTITGATSVSGHIGNALNLGVNKTKFVNLGKPWGTDNTGSFCFWYKSNSINNISRIFTSVSIASVTAFSIITLPDNTIRFRHGGTVGISTFSTNLVETSYSFWVVQVPVGGPAEMYKNGVKETLTGGTVNNWMDGFATPTSFHNLGLQDDGTVVLGEGDFDLDQVRYFTRVLTQSEIDALYNSGVGA
jgi:hypothetical protein